MKYFFAFATAMMAVACSEPATQQAAAQQTASATRSTSSEPVITHHERDGMHWSEYAHESPQIQTLKFKDAYLSHGGWMSELEHEDSYGWGSIDEYFPIELDYRLPLCLYASMLHSDTGLPEGELVGKPLPKTGARTTQAYCFKPGEWGVFMDELKRLGQYPDEEALAAAIVGAYCQGDIRVSGTIDLDSTRVMHARSGNSSLLEVSYGMKVVNARLDKAYVSNPNRCAG